MKECLLCKRDMKKCKDTFGNGCIDNIYIHFLNWNNLANQSIKKKSYIIV